MQSVNPEEAPNWIEERRPTIIDVREPAEYAAGHLPGAVSIPQAELASRVDDLSKSNAYLVVCAGGVRSLRAVHYLSWLGFPKVVSLNGGTAGWANAGGIIEGRVAPPSAGKTPSADQERYIHGAP